MYKVLSTILRKNIPKTMQYKVFGFGGTKSSNALLGLLAELAGWRFLGVTKEIFRGLQSCQGEDCSEVPKTLHKACKAARVEIARRHQRISKRPAKLPGMRLLGIHR